MLNTRFLRNPSTRLGLLGFGLVVCATGVLWAQTPAQPTGGTIDPTTGQLPTLAELFMFSPAINTILAGLSILTLAMLVFLILSINVRTIVPSDFIDEIRKLAERGKYEAASDLCRAHRRVFVATILQRCMENQNKSSAVILSMAEAEGSRRAEILWNRLSYLSDIANVAPMLGLLGTVLGMIKAFFLLERQTGSIDSIALSQGVGEAMSTTMFGLAVGILALVCYTIVKARTTVMLADAEQAVHSVVDHMKREST